MEKGPKFLSLCAVSAAALIFAMAPVASANSTVAASSPTAKTPASAFVFGGNLNTVLDGLQRHYQTTDAFSARFTEQITPVGAPTRSREGQVYFRKPGKMRWEFETPNKELVVSDGEHLYSYDPDLNQVVETPLKQALRAPGATEFLLGVGNIRRDFNASVPAPVGDGLQHVVLTPKQGGNTIEIGLDRTYSIQTIRITDQLGNVTALKFSDLNYKPELSGSLFAFTPPPGADVVRSGVP